MPHAGEMAGGIQNVQIADGPLAGEKELQIVAIGGGRRLPAHSDFIDLVGADFREIEAGLDGERREARVMLETADAFLGNGKEQFTVANDAGGGIVHLGKIQTKRDHSGISGSFRP